MVSLSYMLSNIDKLIDVYKNLEAELGPPTPTGQAEIDAVHGLKDTILRFATIFELTSLPESQEDCEHIIETIPTLYDHRNHLVGLTTGVLWLEEKCKEVDRYTATNQTLHKTNRLSLLAPEDLPLRIFAVCNE